MIQHAMLNGMKSMVWNSHRKEFESVVYELYEAGKIGEELLEVS